jgi:hypothetical protein
MEVRGRLHAPVALPLGQIAQISIRKEAGWVPEPVRELQNEQPCTCRDSNLHAKIRISFEARIFVRTGTCHDKATGLFCGLPDSDL